MAARQPATKTVTLYVLGESAHEAFDRLAEATDEVYVDDREGAESDAQSDGFNVYEIPVTISLTDLTEVYACDRDYVVKIAVNVRATTSQQAAEQAAMELSRSSDRYVDVEDEDGDVVECRVTF